MTPRTCRYGCGMLLEGWDDNARKYIESGSGGLHTKERCQEAKLKLELKNDHGKEDEQTITSATNEQKIKIANGNGGYVDHTQGPKLKLKVLTSTEAEGLSLVYNNFGDSHNIRFSQYQIAGSLYTIAVWYEEIPLKQ